MKRLIPLFGFTVIGCLGLASLSYAAGSKIVEGSVLKVEGEYYTVHDTAGHEVRLHVDKSTHLEGGAFKTGDKIEAHVTDKGHARSIIHLTAAGKTETPGSKIVEGDVLKIEGEFYTVHDTAGHEVRLHVDKKTHLEGAPFKVGDKVEAYATDKGHVRYLYHITQLQPAP
jgi:ribosome-associated protein YbcJ (S4-like RNA binding protein)